MTQSDLKVMALSLEADALRSDGGVVAELCPHCTLRQMGRRGAKEYGAQTLPNGVMKLSHEQYLKVVPHVIS